MRWAFWKSKETLNILSETKMKRILKVSKKGRVNVLRRVKWVPELKLCGNWLALAGIEAGCMVEIEVLKNQIIIHHG